MVGYLELGILLSHLQELNTYFIGVSYCLKQYHGYQRRESCWFLTNISVVRDLTKIYLLLLNKFSLLV